MSQRAATHRSQLLSPLPIVSHSLPVITRAHLRRGTNKEGYLTPKMTFSDNFYLIHFFFKRNRALEVKTRCGEVAIKVMVASTNLTGRVIEAGEAHQSACTF